MGIGEVSSISNTSYLGQGSSVKTAPEVINASEKTTKSNLAPENLASVNAFDTDSKGGEKNEESANGVSSSLRDAVSKINAASQNCEAVFGIHEDTNRVMIKMVDKSTKKTVKEFPAEETLDLIAKAWELAGIMVDEKR